MKSIKRNIVVIIIVFSYSYCYSQQDYGTPSEALAYHKRIIQNPKVYIFEGTVIKQSTKGISTCSIVSINKIYRGSPQLKIGTIKVLTEQSPGIEDGGEGLSKGCTYIIFGNLVDSNVFYSVVADNSLTLTSFDQIDIFSKDYFDLYTHNYVPYTQYDSLKKRNHHLMHVNPEAAKWGNTKYLTVDSLYSFFKENGLTVQEEVKENK